MNLLMKIVLLFYFTNIYQLVKCVTVTCNFEIDECAWMFDSSWKLYASGSTPDTASSGPVADHTTGNGTYARFMATHLAESSPFGILNTTISLDSSTILSFWYFMHGSQIGTLALLVNDVPVWEKSGRQGVPAWYHANVTIIPVNNVKIAFVANRTGLGRSSDIAIDDIVLYDEQMPISTRTPRPPSTTTPRTRLNASCDFDIDKELCGWKSDTKYGWKVIHQRDPDVTIGPSSDYSSIRRATVDGKVCQIPYEENKVQYYYCIPNKNILQCKGSDNKFFNCRDGGFVQIRTNEFDVVGERSQFDSPILDATSEEGCVQFQYNIVGSDDDWLSVYVEDYWTNNQVCVWHMNVTSVPDQWLTAEARLPLEQDGKYKIVFEARKGKAGGLGLVSLDHIVISSTRCSGGYPVIQCPVEETTTTTTTTTPSTTTTTTTTTTESTTEFEATTNESPHTEMTTNDTTTTTTTTTVSTARPTRPTTTTITTPTLSTARPTRPPTTTGTSTTTTKVTTALTSTTTRFIASTTTTISSTASPTNDTDEVNPTTVGSPRDKPSPVGVILGTLGGIIFLVLIVGMYVKR
ncbi:unnamed protein product, partial [Adineta steineri]